MSAGTVWPPVWSAIEECTLQKTVHAVWKLPNDPRFAETEHQAWARVADLLGGAATVYSHHSATAELRWLAEVALQRARQAHAISYVERAGMAETLTRAWSNAQAGRVTWLAVHDWLRSSPRFLIHDSEKLHDELAWLAQVAAQRVDFERTAPMAGEGVQHAYA